MSRGVIVNVSILTETVPHSFKQAKVVPIYKKGSKLDPGNYRPVSVLNVLSKILERAVHGQLSDYLEKKNVLFKNQSGFRSRYSTDTCLISLTDYVKKEIQKGNYVGMVLIDLQKAFDTVNHEILLSKLEAIGVKPDSCSWFRSYLFDREQCVEVNGKRSDFMLGTCGVPQGSIFGPLLFLLYINDLNVSIDCGLSLYADDSALVYSHKDPLHISAHLSAQLANCKHWLIDNRLSLHVGKTEAILYGSAKRLKRVNGFEVTCEGSPVKEVTNVKYLGIYLNNSMDGRSHAESLIKKCAGRISFLYRNSHLMEFGTRKILCSALVQPYIDYCSSSWYSSVTQGVKSKLDVLQRKMVRFVFKLGNMAHVGLPELKQLSWFSIPDRVRYFKLCHVFKIKNRTAPSYLLDEFVLISDTHSHRTRGSTSDGFSISKCDGTLSSFSYTAIQAWNSLPLQLRIIKSESVFKRQLKGHIFLQY